MWEVVCSGEQRASTPVDDFSFVDDEAFIVCCGQAGGVADGAIDIGEVAAGAADHMVMVVAGTGFVSGGRAGGLYPAKKSGPGENRERVIDRLTRDRADSAANIVHNNVGRGMGCAPNGRQNGESLRGYLQSVLTQQRGGVIHYALD